MITTTSISILVVANVLAIAFFGARYRMRVAMDKAVWRAFDARQAAGGAAVQSASPPAAQSKAA